MQPTFITIPHWLICKVNAGKLDFLTQYIFPMAFGSQPQAHNISADANVNGTTAASPGASPTDISSLITLLFSFSALRDWLKLFVIGGFFETCRRFAFAFYYKFINSFFITAHFDEDDSSYGGFVFVS
jgi:hypothetical protein